jgi:uncharacterized protein YbjQ (UPF0145 family)
MTEEAVKRLGFNAKELEADGVVSRDNLSLEESARHQGDTVSEDKVTTGDPKWE